MSGRNQFSFVHRLMALFSLLRMKTPVKPLIPEMARPIPAPGFNGADKPAGGFGNSLTRSYLPPAASRYIKRRPSWWIPPDQRAEPVMFERKTKRGAHRHLLRRAAAMGR